MLNRLLDNLSDHLYFLFRIIIGSLFFLHGLAKLQSLLAGKLPLFDLLAVAAVIEVIAGAFLVLGLFSRYVALISAGEMLIAYFKVHFPQGINPLANNGEPALLFFAAFLVIIAFGSRKWSLETLIRR